MDYLFKVKCELDVVEDELGLVPSLMLAFSLTKCHIVLKRAFLAQLNSQIYFKKHKGRKWVEYFNLPSTLVKKKEYDQQLAHAELEYDELFKRCRYQEEELVKLNPHWMKCFREKITEESLSGDFELCCRASTNYFYGTLKSYLKTHKELQFYYYFTQTVICHFFKELLSEAELKE